MSRIQEILKKAERDGGVHRTRAIVTDRPAPAAPVLVEPAGSRAEPPVVSRAEPPAISLVETAPVRRVEPPAVSRAEPPVVTRVEPPGVNRVDPPAVEQPIGRFDPPGASAGTVEAPYVGFTPVPPAAAGTARHGHVRIDSRLVAAVAPQSLAAEQYRLLRTRVTRAENGRPCRAIIITSPNKGDGKSLTAANLALTIAQDPQQRVLLFDADLRRPSIHHLFGISETPGLSDVLMGGATLDEALVTIPEHRLTVLPSGLIPTQPAELLGSQGMRRVLEALRSRFDRILIDMPPVAPLADVAIASTMADGVLMIVRAGVTPKPAIERALAGVEGAKVLGLVLNDAGASGSSYRYAGYRYAAG
jgi:capsular exopolysaccharide synthesis family protein